MYSCYFCKTCIVFCLQYKLEDDRGYSYICCVCYYCCWKPVHEAVKHYMYDNLQYVWGVTVVCPVSKVQCTKYSLHPHDDLVHIPKVFVSVKTSLVLVIVTFYSHDSSCDSL